LQYARQAAERAAGKRPEETKEAFLLPSWGGGTMYAQSKLGPGVEMGYSHLLGLVPFPHVGVRLGGRRMGASVGLPYVGVDSGREPGIGHHWNYPESIWSHLLQENQEGEEKEEGGKKKKKPTKPKEEESEEPKSMSMKLASVQAMLRALRS
jgi:hypothetical protein